MRAYKRRHRSNMSGLSRPVIAAENGYFGRGPLFSWPHLLASGGADRSFGGAGEGFVVRPGSPQRNIAPSGCHRRSTPARARREAASPGRKKAGAGGGASKASRGTRAVSALGSDVRHSGEPCGGRIPRIRAVPSEGWCDSAKFRNAPV